MKIKQIEIYKSPVKLKNPFIISLGRVDYAENIIVVIRTDNDITGFGECSPFKTINGESIDTCFIVGQYFATGLLGMDPANIGECHQLMNRIIYANSSIKSAFDIALYDITSQDAGLPLFAFLGGNKNKSLITDYTVSIGDPVKMADDARKIQEEGFQFIKVKLGNSGKKDIERIRVIRQAVGSDIPLRIDANQGWDTQEAIETLGSLSQFNIQFCEEPVARWNYMDLPKIKKASLIPIMADESCCDHHDAKRLIDIAACDYFNVKLGKSAGIFNALKIIQLAEKNGVKIQIGGFLESRLGFSASAHLALANENIVYFDFDTPLMLLEDHVVDGISYSPVGVVSVPDKPGLGAAISETHLKKLEQVVIK